MSLIFFCNSFLKILFILFSFFNVFFLYKRNHLTVVLSKNERECIPTSSNPLQTYTVGRITQTNCITLARVLHKNQAHAAGISCPTLRHSSLSFVPKQASTSGQFAHVHNNTTNAAKRKKKKKSIKSEKLEKNLNPSFSNTYEYKIPTVLIIASVNIESKSHQQQ